MKTDKHFCFLAVVFLVQESCHVRDCTSIVSASSTLGFFVLLGIPHVLPEVGVDREDGVVLG